jgi:hypothetical protein
MHDPQWRRYGDRSRAARIRRLFDERMAGVYKNADVPSRRHEKGLDLTGSEYHIAGTRGYWMRRALDENIGAGKTQNPMRDGAACYNDNDFRKGCEKFGYDMGAWMGAGNGYNDLRKEIASCYLSAGNECAAARVLFGRPLAPSGYSWIMQSIIRHKTTVREGSRLVYTPYSTANYLDAYVQRFMQPE